MCCRPGNYPVVGVQLVLVRKRDQYGNILKYKARLVVLGNQMKDLDKWTELFAPVAQITTFRVMCAVAAVTGDNLKTIDFTQAFLAGGLPKGSNIYVRQGPGRPVKLDSMGRPYVYKLKKSLYGLCTAPRIWHSKLHDWLVSNDFVRSTADPCLYTLTRGTQRLNILCYVDDCCLQYADSSAPLYESVLRKLASDGFRFTGDGQGLGKELDWFLGYGVKRDRHSGTVTIDQLAFKQKILEDCNMADCAAVDNPALPGTRLGHHLCPDDSPAGMAEKEEMKKLPYRKVVGSLLWLNRGVSPELSYTVGMLARVMHNPSKQHWEQAMRTLRYIRGHMEDSLVYGNKSADSGVVLRGAVDADWLGMYGDKNDNMKSTTGWFFFVGGAAVSWRSRRQEVIATATAMAESIAACGATKEALHLRSLLGDLGHSPSSPTILDEDNQAAIRISLNPSDKERCKHWDMRHHWLREQVRLGKVDLQYVRTQQQLADIATKPVGRTQFEQMRDHLLGKRHISVTRYAKLSEVVPLEAQG